MTPPASIARSDSIAAGARLQEDGIRTGLILADTADDEDKLLNVDIHDESTITFRRPPARSALKEETRLDLDRTCASQSGDSDVADEVETEPVMYNKFVSLNKTKLDDDLSAAAVRPKQPVMGKLSLSHGTSKNELKTRPSTTASLTNTKGRMGYSRLDTINDRSSEAARRRRDESTDCDDGDGAAPSSARHAETRDRARATDGVNAS